MDRTLVVSATNTLAAGFQVIPLDRKGRDGQPVNALFAVARAIARVLTFKLPARAVAVIEANIPASWPAQLKEQLPALPELLRALGCQVVVAADEQNTVASYAQAALDAGDDVIVVGRDKRYAQLVSDHVWWYDSNKDVRYTTDIVYKRFTVGPDKVAGWLALVGDLDSLPGVKGIGAKGATQLIEEQGSVEAALAKVDTLEGRLGKALRAAGDSASAELARATLDRKRDLPRALAELTFSPLTVSELNAVLDRLGFAELLAAEGDTIRTEVCDSAEAMSIVLGALAGKTVAVHALIEDPAPIRGVLVGVAVTAGDGTATYVPVASAAWPVLAAWLADENTSKIGHDLVALDVALRRMDGRLGGAAGDSMHASHLSQPSNWAPHDLTVVAKQVLGRALPEDDEIRGVGRGRKQWGALSIDAAARCAGQRADAAHVIWTKLSPALEPALLAEYRALAQTVVRMELGGVIVEPAALDRATEAFAAIEAELTQQIEALAGHSFNINSGPQLGTVLFEELKLPIVSHTKTGWSTAIEALERIGNAHPIVPLVIRWRLLRRLRDAWLNSLRKLIDEDGRVHSRSHIARSFSGDLVNTNPDLSRVPGRTPEMAMIRRSFVAAPGHLLMSVDFNQLGLHVLAHLTKDPALVEPLRARADMHTLTASAVLDKPVDAITTDDRQLGKVVNFATFAGQGPSALALQLGVSAADAKALIARFDTRYAKVREFQDEQLRLAKERGYITTIAGRKWPIGGLESLDNELRSYAERLARRATHEGSVADVARRALLQADRALRDARLDATPIVQVVDEVLFEVRESELMESARIAADAMRSAFAPLEVPLVVGVEAGKTWADLEPVAI